MTRSIPGLMTLALSALLCGQPAFAQSSPMSNCKYYVKTQGDFAQGLPHCVKAIEEEPENPEARFFGGTCLAETGQLEEAWTHFSWLIERKDHPDKKVRKEAKKAEKQALYYYKKFFNKGVELLEAGDRQSSEAAMLEFQKATTILPTKIDAHLNLGYSQTLLADLDGAIDSFHRAIEIDPDHEKAHTYYWDALRQKLERLRKERAPAEEIKAVSAKLRTTLARVLEFDPSQHEAIMQLADIELAEGNTDAAIGHVSKAIEIAPETVYKLIEMGQKFYNNSDYDSAIRCFKIVMDRLEPDDPNYQQALTVLGWSYFFSAVEEKEDKSKATEHFGEAVPVFEQLIEMQPEEKDHYLRLGLALTRLEKQKEASEYLMKYEELKEKEVVGE